MEICKKCGRKFVVTSWTKDRFWREVCPRCIVELCEMALEKAPKTLRAWAGRD